MKLKQWLDEQPTGTAVRLSAYLNVSNQSVYSWRDGGKIPATRVLDIWAFTSGEVHPYEMRPDIYPRGVVTFNLDEWLSQKEGEN